MTPPDRRQNKLDNLPLPLMPTRGRLRVIARDAPHQMQMTTSRPWNMNDDPASLAVYSLLGCFSSPNLTRPSLPRVSTPGHF